MPKDNRKPKLDIPLVDGSFYWVRPFENDKFEPAVCRRQGIDGMSIYFRFTDGSRMDAESVWEAEPLNHD